MSAGRYDLEAVLRDRYASLDPGAAPTALRRVVEQIPATDPGLERGRARAWSVYVGLAAALAILALALSGLRGLQLDVAPGATIGPGTTFDPTLEGPGIVDAPSPGGNGPVVIVAVLGCGFLAIVLRGWRRSVPASLAGLALAYGLIAAFVPIEVSTHGFGMGIAITRPEMPRGASEEILYEVAQPGEPFSFAVYLSEPSGPFPITIEGVVDHESPPAGPRLVAAWNDELPIGSKAPGRPFVPGHVSNGELTLWLVGRAGPCAAGAPPDGDVAMIGLAPVKLRVSVLGWPREVELTRVPAVWEPYEPGCEPSVDPSSRVP